MLPGDAKLLLSVERGYEAILTVDGLHQSPVESGTLVEVSRSPRTTKFVRLGGPAQFYANIAKRLGWLREDHSLGDLGDDPSHAS